MKLDKMTKKAFIIMSKEQVKGILMFLDFPVNNINNRLLVKLHSKLVKIVHKINNRVQKEKRNEKNE